MAGQPHEQSGANRPFIDIALDSFSEHPEHDQLREMLEGYSPNGQIVMISFLMYAREDGVLDKAVEVLERTHETHWKFQHPEMRGDPDMTIANASHLTSMMSEAGVQWPRPQNPPTT